MSGSGNPAYLRALGARLLSEANDLKRTPDALADELGMTRTDVRAVLSGHSDRAAAERVLLAMTTRYPVSLSDLWVEPDDTDDGAVIWREKQSAATARVFNRRNASGNDTNYYEYRDTAMSRIGGFKPEWIQPLRVVGNADANNPDVAYNKGHLLHQTTFFIGAVNFYWKIDGHSYCREMNTGDSNFITPFVPHSFTSRDASQLGLIIAVTYAAHVRRAINDLGHLTLERLEKLAGSIDDPVRAFHARLRRHLAADSLSAGELSERLATAGVATDRAKMLAGGHVVATATELEMIAAALSITPADLMPLASNVEPPVILRPAGQTVRGYPAGNRPVAHLSELARAQRQPGLKGFSIDVVADGRGVPFQHGLNQYLYVHGNTPVRLFWAEGREAILAPGDSAYLRPMVPHAFAPIDEGGSPQLLVVRVQGGMNDAVLDEYASFATAGRHRVLEETTKWF